VVLAKYAAALAFVAIVVTPVVLSAFLLQRLSPGLPPLDVGAMGTGCAFLLLFAALGVAVGELVSLTTRNQIVAAICGFCALWLVLLGGWLLTVLPLRLAGLGRYVSATAHLEAMARGILDTRTVVLFVSATAFVLFAAVRVLEARRWK
jgi:ABC-2 type transport system permease protein